MQIDRAGRWIDLKLVYWGPARGGKTTSLRSLHGAFAAAERGDLQSIETDEERTYFFDYAPLDLPRWRDHQIRVHAYTVPGQETYVETRRRILRGVDGVLFVADATPSARAGNASSWRELDGALCSVENGRRSVPIVVAANKIDLPGADRRDALLARLAEAVPVRRPLDVVETAAVLGTGVGRCFREVLLAAAADRLSLDVMTGVAARDGFGAELARRLGRSDDGLPVEEAPARRVVAVGSKGVPDAGGLDAALESTRWLTERDLDARDLARRHALARLLLEVGRHCLAASAPDALAATTLAAVVPALGASFGWLGFTDPAGAEHVFDSKGRAVDGASAATLARVMGLAAEDGAVAPLDVPAGSGLRPGAEGRRGLFTPFSVGDGRRGFLLLLGADERGLPAGAEDVLAPAGAYLGLTVSRLHALARLRDVDATLERKVEERTRAIRRERDAAEERARERTRALETAERAIVAAERRLLDRVALRGHALPEEAPSSRRAAVRTPLGEVVRDAVTSHAKSRPGVAAPAIVERAGLACGVPAEECARWVLRLLGVLDRSRIASLRVEVQRHDGRPCVSVETDPPCDLAHDADLDALRDEVQGAGGSVVAASSETGSSVRLALPPAVDEVADVLVDGAR